MPDAGVEYPRVLVTGGAGFVGSHTVLELLTEGYSVVVLDNCTNSASGDNGSMPPSLERVHRIVGRRPIFHQVSLLDKESLIDIFNKYSVDIVIHFAALKAVGESVSHPLMYYKNNVTGTINLLEVMSDAGVKNLVFSSSATVYGAPEYLPIDEDHPTGQNITNPYGRSKYMCEQIMKDACLSDPEWKIILLRYFNPVGAHSLGMIGEDPRGIPNNLMPFVSQVAIGRRKCLSIFGNDYDTVDGTGVRDYIHVVDLAKGHVAALKKVFKSNFSGCKAYNLGTGKGVSVLQLVKVFEKCSGMPIPYEVVTRRTGDVGAVIASCDLATSELNWRAVKSLEDMCSDAWRWQKNNPDGFQS